MINLFKSYKANAMIHSIGKVREVDIVDRKSGNQTTYVARYEGKNYTCIFNPFTGLYYVDDKYGQVVS